MRTAVIALLLSLGLVTMSNATTIASPRSTGSVHAALTAPALDAQQPGQGSQPLNVDINVNHSGGRWYASPVWIAIGGLAVLLILVLIVAATRSGGGGTTIVKD